MKSKLSIAREISYDAFIKVIEHKYAPDQATELLFKKQKEELSRLDKNFIKESLYGSLRWYKKIYWILQKTSKRELKKTSPEIRAALILGAYQIFYMDRVPDRAAVNESVEYIRKKGQARAVNFINGILRSIASRSEYFPKPDKDKHPAQYLSLQYAHPEWIVNRWCKRFNFEKLKSILANNNNYPPYTIRVNSNKVNLEEIPDLRNVLLKKRNSKALADLCVTAYI